MSTPAVERSRSSSVRPADDLASIIVNNYDYGRFLAAAIDSALNQTYSPIEVIVVDDGSTDESREVLAGYGDSVRALLTPNRGQAAAINLGIEESRGRYLCLLDSDDSFSPEKVATAIAFLRAGELEDRTLVAHPLELVDECGRSMRRIEPDLKRRRHPPNLYQYAARYGYVPYVGAPTSGLVFNRALADRIFPIPTEHTRTCADGPIVRAASLIGQVRWLSTPLGTYRVHGDNRFQGGTRIRSLEQILVEEAFLNGKLREDGRTPVLAFLDSMFARSLLMEAGNRRALVRAAVASVRRHTDVHTVGFGARTLAMALRPRGGADDKLKRRRRGRSDRRRVVDLVVVRVGSTSGHRRSEAELLRALDELGVDWAAASTDYGLLGRIPLSLNLLDIGHAASIRWATTRTLRSVSPRALMYTAAGATLLEPVSRLGRAAVRFDALASENRPGRRHAVQRALEQRSLARARVLLPFGTRSTLQVDALGGLRPIIPLPTPVEPYAAMAHDRSRIAVCYAGAPEKKGLELVVTAWARAPVPAGYQLLVTGIDERDGRAYLRRKGVTIPLGVTWGGRMAPHDYRTLLSRAEIYIAASRFEDYGIGQLEALADGALLVSVPSRGPYEALALARQLEPGLVAEAISGPALAVALGRAFALDSGERHRYRHRAQTLLAPYSRAVFREQLRSKVLPSLLDDELAVQ